METLSYRIDMAHHTIDTLEEALQIIKDPANERLYETCRDSLIQRFEYSIDTLWKCLKVYLQEELKMSLEIITPREVIRAAAEARLVSESEYSILLECIADRNLTSHTYQAVLAQEMVERIPVYYTTMRSIIVKIEL